MKNFKYILSILLSALCIILPVLGILLSVFRPGIASYAVLGASVVYGVVLWKPLWGLRIKTRRSVEYDEFGRSKSKGQYERLSKKERDQIDLQNTAIAEGVLSTAAVKKMTKRGSDDPQKDLDQLIGLQPIKLKVEEMAARMEFEQSERKKKKGQSSAKTGRHAVFFGSPGTGKTTVAKILTGFLYKYGYIKENKYIETDGNFLKAGTQTAMKTALTIREAYGGVLFIDEAYALMEGDGYGREAIATIIKEMEDNRDRFVLIFAGYTKEMQSLLKANPGFESRIKEYLHFPDYSIPEMQEIFRSMANSEGFTVAADALPVLEDRLEKERKLSSFGNARTVRSILDEALDRHAVNYKQKIISENGKYIIQGIDVSREPSSQRFAGSK